MMPIILLICLPLALAQVPVYLRTPALPASVLAAQYPQSIYQPYGPAIAPSPYRIVPTVATAPEPIVIAQPVVAPVSPPVVSGYQPYGSSYAYIPVVPSCLPQCMPTCAPTCVESTVPTTKPQRDDLPTPPPETVPTPAPEVSTTTTTVPTDVVPCKCLIKITITQGGKQISKCGPNSCSCPQGYNQCGSNCCKA